MKSIFRCVGVGIVGFSLAGLLGGCVHGFGSFGSTSKSAEKINPAPKETAPAVAALPTERPHVRSPESVAYKGAPRSSETDGQVEVIQVASADMAASGYSRSDRIASEANSPAVAFAATKSPAATGSDAIDGNDATSWKKTRQETLQFKDSLLQISEAQLAQDAATSKSAAGEDDLGAANKEFNNPLTQATLFIIENDTLILDGDLSDGKKAVNVTVFEPIIPVPLGDSGWTLVNRPILPVAFSAPIPVAGSGGSAAEGGTLNFDDKSGLGDFTFFSMLAPPTEGNFKYGFGITSQWPTATDDQLGSEQYSFGPAAVALYGTEKFTLGLLNQNWFSVAGDDDRESVAKSTLQYFAFYNFTPQWGIGTAPIISYNWDADDSDDKLALPVGLGVTHTFKLGDIPSRVLLEGQYYAVQRDSFGPEWNIRLAFGMFLPPLF